MTKAQNPATKDRLVGGKFDEREYTVSVYAQIEFTVFAESRDEAETIADYALGYIGFDGNPDGVAVWSVNVDATIEEIETDEDEEN